MLEKRRWDLALDQIGQRAARSSSHFQEIVWSSLASSVGTLPGRATLEYQDLQPYPMGITLALKACVGGVKLFCRGVLYLFQPCPCLSVDLIHRSLSIPRTLDFAISFRPFEEDSTFLVGLSLKFIKGCFPFYSSYDVPWPLVETHRCRLIIEISPSNSATPNLGGLGIGKPITLLMQQLLTDLTDLPSLHSQPPTS